MKAHTLCVLAAFLAVAPTAYTQDRPARLAQRVSEEKVGDDVAAVLTTEDFGTVKERGTALYSNGTYRIKSSGADIWGRADSFHFTSMLLDGDAEFVARVVSVDRTGPWAKAGLMLREAGTTDARHAFLAVTPDNGFTLQYRTGPKERTMEAAPRSLSAGRTEMMGPGWIRILRQGDRVTGFSSPDGTNWVWEGTVHFAGLARELQAGLAVSSHDPARICTAVFDQVAILPVAPVAAAPVPSTGQGTGLQARYFTGLDLSGPTVSRVDPSINFEWQKGEPAPGITREKFGVRWEGEIQPQFTEPYSLHLLSDDRARLWINGRLIIDDRLPHTLWESAGRVPMVAGQKYLIRIEYFQHGGPAVAKLLWSSPSTPRQVVPTTQLYPVATDSDGDGMPDLWELDHDLNPANPSDATGDPDADGISNLAEYRAGRNPRLSDSYTQGLPAPWRGSDIGAPAVKGSASHSGGTLAVTSAGADIWGSLDSFHFVHQPLTGDGEIIARVISLQNTDPWAKASVMLRAGLAEEARHVMLAFTPEKGLSFQHRSVAGGISFDEPGGAATPPRWIKLTRRGQRFNAFRSDDGKAWEWLATEEVEMPRELLAGLAVSSHAAGLATTAVFDQVSVRPLPDDQLPAPVVGRGDGLGATYFDNVTKTLRGRLDPIVDFDWGAGRPAPEIGSDYFSVRWEGLVEAQYDETYAFHVITDDGARLWVDGVLLIDAWDDRGATRLSGKLRLTAGRKYLLKLEYYERKGEAVARLHWSSPSTAKQPVPTSQLYSPQHPDYGRIDDKDKDGLPDAWERRHGLDETDASDAATDPDKDGLTNLEEYAAGTDPRRADTDDDGIPDGWEVRHRLNPREPRDAAQDLDRDGLTNFQEFTAGSDPYLEDTDRDGLTDGMEVTETGTSPLTDDILDIRTVAEARGADASQRLGEWTVDGASIVATGRRGAVEYVLKTSRPGMYRLEIESAVHSTSTLRHEHPLILSVDGELLGRRVLVHAASGLGTAHVFTPWLAPGTHVVRIFWDNAAPERSFRVSAVRFQSLLGLDANRNGVSDWIEARLRALSGVEWRGETVANGAPILSPVSPAFIEGRGRYLSMMQVPEGVVPRPAPDNRWYADVPLSAAGRTLTVSFQNGGVVQSNRLAWQPTDLRTSGDLMIRAGDALLLAMSAAEAEASVRIDVPGLGAYAGVASNTFPCRFASPGRFVVTGVLERAGQSAETRSITVHVIAAEFADQPAVWAGKSRLWTVTNLPPAASVQADSRLTLEPLPSTDSNRLYGLALDVEEPHPILARLGTNGPVLHHTAADGFRLYSGAETGVKLVDTLEDGSQLVEMTIVCSPVLPQITIHVDLVVAGVVFEDGSISLVLAAGDFNALGESVVRFIRPADAQTSVCHKTRVFQRGEYLGIYR